MSSATSIRVLFCFLLSLSAPRFIDAAVSIAAVGKESFFYQGGPDPEDLIASAFDPVNDNYPYSIFASIDVDNQSDVTSASVRLTGGATVDLDWDDGSYEVFQGFGTEAALDLGFPDGDYIISFTPSGGSLVSKTLSLTQPFPNPPYIENWFDLQHFPAGEDVTIRWNAMSNGAADDIITLEIHDFVNWDTVFETGLHYREPGGLDGTARSVTVPAGTLTEGEEYQILVGFNNVETVDDGITAPGVLFGSILYAETGTLIRTVTRHPSSVISWGLLSRWTTYRQIGDSILEGDEEPYVFASIWLDDPSDLTGASVSGLELETSADGWSFFQPVGNTSELANWFSNGEHELIYNFAAGGSHLTNLNLTGGPLPAVRLANWNELQAATTSTVTPIRWMAPENVKSGDAYIVKVEDSGGSILWESDLDFDSDVGLGWTDTSVNVPAGIMAPGQVYTGSISRLQFTDIDRGSQTDAVFAAANGVETRFTINTGAAANDPVQLVAVGREVYYTQTGPGAPVLDLQDSEQFGTLAVAAGESVHELQSASVTLPGGEIRSLVYDSEDNEYISLKSNPSSAAMLADFPAGVYTVSYQITGGAKVDVVMTLDDVFPGAPRITNWNETQSVRASDAFTLTWAAVEEMGENDAIQLYIDGPQGGVFETPLIFVDPEGLDGTATSFTIPAGTLEPDTDYEVTLDAIRIAGGDTTGIGRIDAAFNNSATGITLRTTSGNQPPVISTETLGDAEEGVAYQGSITASDNEDGSMVTFNAGVLPGWLVLTDLETGTALLSGTPTATNVGTFTVRVSVADTAGLVSTREYSLAVNPDLSDPEGRALDIASIGWQRDGTAPFVTQIQDVQQGESALVSGQIGDGVASSLQASFTGPLKLSFYWKVSSQAGKDFFRVRVDGVTAAEISGSQNWREQVIDVPAGAHTVRWAYEKDGSGSSGSDRGWLDHVTILPPDAGVFAGTYLGNIKSSTGTVSLFIRPNNTAVFLGYHPESGKGLSNFSFALSESGDFTFEVANPDDMDDNYTVTGTVSNGVATGSVSGLGLNFTASLVSGGGQLVSYDGYYQNALTATTSGLVYLIVATDGQAYFYAEDRDYVEGYITSIDAQGNIALLTDKGFDYDLKVDPATDIVAGSYTPPGGETSSILGIREGAPGDELLANISTRGQVLAGDKVMIASFVITGDGAKSLLVRAIGPRLTDFGVAGVLEDPVIDLIRLGEQVPMVTNDDWGDGGQTNRIIGETARLGGFPLNVGSRDSVMAVSLEPGAYTARIRGNSGLTGVSLVEVYDADDTTERLSTADVVNIATRGEVGTAGDVLIAGFVVSGDVPKRILLRGIGPQLAVYGVAGALVDPLLELVDSSDVLVATNDNWGENPDVAAVLAATTNVGAFPLEDGSKDAALLIWLEPGAYTAKLSGADGGTGVALIEVYDN